MARRRRQPQARSRRRSRQFVVEGLEGRRLLAANVAVASDVGPSSTPLVRLVDAETGAEQASVMAFESGFKGGVRLAMGRVTGNAAADVVAGCGSGRVAEVKVFRGTTLTPVLSFRPFGDSYLGGVEVAVGNVDGTGTEDIIVSKSRDGGDVKIFRVTNSGTTATLYATIAKPFGASYNGGSSVGVADVGEFANGALVKSLADGKVEVLVGSGAGMPAQVRVYDISRPATPRLADTINPAFNTAFGLPFQGGVTVTSGRYAASGVADSIDEIVVSAGRGGSGAVQTIVYDGTVAATDNTVLKSFATFGANQRPNAAVFAAPVDVDGNGQIDRFLVTQGDPGGPAGISNVSIAGVRAATAITSLAGPLRIAAPRTVFATRTISGTVKTPSPMDDVPDGASRPMLIRDIVTGSGAVANTWDKITVQYTGMLANGTVFDTSRQTGRTAFELTLGAGQVIPGWEAGLVGMKVGGRRLLMIPPALAYGDDGQGDIPGRSRLFFDVELVSVTPNRTATITGTATGSVTEDGTSTTGGTLTVTDPDHFAGNPPNIQNRFQQPASLAGTYGTFAFNATSGVWGYTLDNTRPVTQALTSGQTVSDTLLVKSIDGSATRTITVTVAGANDIATIGGGATAFVAKDAATLTVGNSLTASDADTGEAAFTAPGSLAGTYGAFTFNATTGAWTYTLDTSRPATSGLTADQAVTDSLSVTSKDGTAQRAITVTVTGATMQTISAAVATPSPTAGVAAGSTSTILYRDLTTGSGTLATAGKLLTVNYTGKLTNGTVFDSSLLPGRSPFEFTLGAGEVIRGWDAGFAGMKVGGRRLLVIPPELAYGDAVRTGIPSKSTLIFEVELLGVS